MKATNRLETIMTNMLINNVPEGYHMYYNRAAKGFVAYEDDSLACEHDDGNLVLCPCMYYHEWEVCKRFREILTDEESTIASNYYSRKGYFRHLEETGLICKYREAEDYVAVQVFEEWLLKNNIPFNWDNIVVL